jgi:hypothetical protein
MITITFRIDDEEHILTAQVWEIAADGRPREHPVTADTVEELPPDWAAAIRQYVSETRRLAGEVKVG